MSKIIVVSNDIIVPHYHSDVEYIAAEELDERLEERPETVVRYEESDKDQWELDLESFRVDLDYLWYANFVTNSEDTTLSKQSRLHNPYDNYEITDILLRVNPRLGIGQKIADVLANYQEWQNVMENPKIKSRAIQTLDVLSDEYLAIQMRITRRCIQDLRKDDTC